MAKSGLGTGLGALIGKPAGTQGQPAKVAFPAPLAQPLPAPGESVQEVPVGDLRPSPLQPRGTFREDQLAELVDSIKEHGIIQPLIARHSSDGHLELIAGERRWRASQKAGLEKVPVIIRQASDGDVLEMALIENLQREDLNPIEEARAYLRLAEEFTLRQEDIAKRVGKNRVTVANALRLLDLDAEVQTHLAQNRISVGHAKVLLGLKEPPLQRAAAEAVIKQALTVRATEKLVSSMGNPKSKSGTPTPIASATVHEIVLPPVLAQIQARLRERLATSVRLIPGGRKGRIEIEYYGDADLGRLLDLFGLPEEEF